MLAPILLGLILMQPVPTAEQTLRSALAALEAGRWNEAVGLFQRLLAIRPEQHDLKLALAQAYLGAQDPANAIVLLEQCVFGRPSDSGLRLLLAQTYQSLDRDSEALETLGSHVPPQRLQPQWLFLQAFSLFRLNDCGAAAPIFLRLMEWPEMKAPAHFFRANCLALDGEMASALPDYAAAIQASHGFSNRALNVYHHNYGLALFRLARFEEALSQFGQSTDLFAADPLPWFFQARCLMELKRDRDAIRALRTLVGRFPDFSPGWYRLAQLLVKQGEREEANRCLERVKELKQEEFELSERLLLRPRVHSNSGPPGIK